MALDPEHVLGHQNGQPFHVKDMYDFFIPAEGTDQFKVKDISALLWQRQKFVVGKCQAQFLRYQHEPKSMSLQGEFDRELPIVLEQNLRDNVIPYVADTQRVLISVIAVYWETRGNMDLAMATYDYLSAGMPNHLLPPLRNVIIRHLPKYKVEIHPFEESFMVVLKLRKDTAPFEVELPIGETLKFQCLWALLGDDKLHKPWVEQCQRIGNMVPVHLAGELLKSLGGRMRNVLGVAVHNDMTNLLLGTRTLLASSNFLQPIIPIVQGLHYPKTVLVPAYPEVTRADGGPIPEDLHEEQSLATAFATEEGSEPTLGVAFPVYPRARNVNNTMMIAAIEPHDDPTDSIVPDLPLGPPVGPTMVTPRVGGAQVEGTEVAAGLGLVTDTTMPPLGPPIGGTAPVEGIQQGGNSLARVPSGHGVASMPRATNATQGPMYGASLNDGGMPPAGNQTVDVQDAINGHGVAGAIVPSLAPMSGASALGDMFSSQNPTFAGLTGAFNGRMMLTDGHVGGNNGHSGGTGGVSVANLMTLASSSAYNAATAKLLEKQELDRKQKEANDKYDKQQEEEKKRQEKQQEEERKRQFELEKEKQLSELKHRQDMEKLRISAELEETKRKTEHEEKRKDNEQLMGAIRDISSKQDEGNKKVMSGIENLTTVVRTATKAPRPKAETPDMKPKVLFPTSISTPDDKENVNGSAGNAKVKSINRKSEAAQKVISDDTGKANDKVKFEEADDYQSTQLKKLVAMWNKEKKETKDENKKGFKAGNKLLMELKDETFVPVWVVGTTKANVWYVSCDAAITDEDLPGLTKQFKHQKRFK